MGSYMLLDLMSTLMEKDPYYVIDPDQLHQRHPLPQYLQGLPPWLLLAYREVLSLMACLSHILSGNSHIDLMQYWTLRTLFPSRSGLWMHASSFGSFSQVLDRGLSGWWGAFWHQTFPSPFPRPSNIPDQRGLHRGGYGGGGRYVYICIVSPVGPAPRVGQSIVCSQHKAMETSAILPSSGHHRPAFRKQVAAAMSPTPTKATAKGYQPGVHAALAVFDGNALL